jgi:hypothetical protein
MLLNVVYLLGHASCFVELILEKYHVKIQGRKNKFKILKQKRCKFLEFVCTLRLLLEASNRSFPSAKQVK